VRAGVSDSARFLSPVLNIQPFSSSCELFVSLFSLVFLMVSGRFRVGTSFGFFLFSLGLGGSCSVFSTVLFADKLDFVFSSFLVL